MLLEKDLLFETKKRSLRIKNNRNTRTSQFKRLNK